ncbi:hypothetical protein EZS27_020433 [termite gut metagenome]|uniref:Uncharacterized protein n=1 Tax=termite gut metagenome TaxID=433724 RepID=A0A5J4RAW7_9ZZZZ
MKSKFFLLLFISVALVMETSGEGFNKRRNIAFCRAVYQSSAKNFGW